MAKRAYDPKRTTKKATKKKAAKKKVAKKRVAKKKVAFDAIYAAKAGLHHATRLLAKALVKLDFAGDPKEATKQAALVAIDNKLEAAGEVKNNCTTLACDQKMDKCIADLGEQSTAIYNQDYIAAISDPDFTKAMTAIRQATEDMNDVAPNMTSATSFINSLAGFFTAASKIVPALKGLS